MYINNIQLYKTNCNYFYNWLDYLVSIKDKYCVDEDFFLFNFNDNFKLFSSFTTKEFEKSIAFIEKSMKERDVPSYLGEISFKTLIIFSIIFSKKNLSLNTINFGICLSEKRQYIANFLGLEEHIPVTLLNRIDLWEKEELELALYLLEGKSVRKYPKLNLSKKEAHIFRTSHFFPCFNLIDESLLSNYVLFIKIIKNHPNEFKFINDFFSRTIIDTLKYVKNEFKYSKNYNLIFNKLYTWRLQNPELNINTILDYIKSETDNFRNTNFSLKGRTVKSLTRSIEQWHRELYQLSYNFNYELEKNAKWVGSTKNDTIVKIENKTYHLTQIKTGERLFVEGLLLEHCVITYIDKFRAGESSIWNLHLENSDRINDITFEIHNNNLLQAAGLRNREPSTSELAVINEWLTQTN